MTGEELLEKYAVRLPKPFSVKPDAILKVEILFQYLKDSGVFE